MIVLNYHRLVDGEPDSDWCLETGLFDGHLDVLGERLIGPELFMERFADPRAHQSDDVLLTFDDAFLSDYEIVYGRYMLSGRIPGFMSFVPTDHVGAPGRMTWDMIRELDSAGVPIGSHGLAHEDMTTLSPRERSAELRRSKHVLEDALGRPVDMLAFPYGRFSRPVWEEALDAGYSTLFTIQLGHHRGFEPFLCSRLCMTNDMDERYIARHVADPDTHRGVAYKVTSRLGIYRALMHRRYA